MSIETELKDIAYELKEICKKLNGIEQELSDINSNLGYLEDMTVQLVKLNNNLEEIIQSGLKLRSIKQEKD